MSKQIIIAEQHRIAAVFSGDQIQELIVATGSHQVSDIYLGIVENVLPGIDAAFVNIGDSERNGFIHVSDLGPLRLKKAAAPITELLVPQQKVLVQIMKEPTGNKGPRLTGNISLPGRYLVLMPSGRGVNLSRRIRNENERNRLRALAILVKPAGMGLLVRTEAEGVPEEAIIEDLEALQKQWEAIQLEAANTRPPCLLNRDDDFIQRVLRDVYSADVNRIVVDSHTGAKRVKQHLMNWSGGKAPVGVLIDHHRERTPILEYFRVNAAIREALKPRVDLPSGGYIIIERTEALTVIDVNSGSFTRSATARETVLWTNCEAAAEIARQLRLRNIAGVIVVDFIDMDSHRDKLQVLEQFNKALRADKARPQIAQLTELGLVELTRKRQGKNIYELFGKACPTCGGLGHVVHLPGDAEEVAVPAEVPRTFPAAHESRAVQLREPWDAPELEFGSPALAEQQELDLTNHPSYQDRSRVDSRRRRRSRPPRSAEPVVRGNGGRSPDLEADTDAPVALEELPVLNGSTPTLGKESREGREGREGRSEKPERGGRGRRERAAAEPQQVITVEMTPEEQEIYALMGVSPLVLAPEPVKDPKTTVVMVALPGQGRQAANSTASGTTSGNGSGISAALLQEKEKAESTPAPDPILKSAALAEPVAHAESLPTEVAIAPVSSDPEDGDAAGDSSAPRRRRRRRSSVSADESAS
ncbi:Rne/Rng family ribonuclease [Thermoleptolyngbya sp. C42_A2020_037]|uniref:Rne/Rng family ribonuclease n=1 Tax=Thermoleptolyngbya sp. C42_A2020_037 TaxID=2747799 RepID=UPI0019ED7AA5|nr:Rne/Rng family ribonuclease [Thermoleptolyngbya sp. C42_A2020_037]MBF2085189.1 ribonuclease E/G [Thermoleptolyngbya sp. C42_A2020_037]